jgi:hypothetical protein
MLRRSRMHFTAQNGISDRPGCNHFRRSRLPWVPPASGRRLQIPRAPRGANWLCFARIPTTETPRTQRRKSTSGLSMNSTSSLWPLCLSGEPSEPRQIGFVCTTRPADSAGRPVGRRPVPSVQKLALFHRDLLHVQSAITPSPSSTCPSCRVGGIGFVWRDGPANWLCFAQTPCRGRLAVAAGKLALFRTDPHVFSFRFQIIHHKSSIAGSASDPRRPSI